MGRDNALYWRCSSIEHADAKALIVCHCVVCVVYDAFVCWGGCGVLPLETVLRNSNDQQGLGIVLGFSGIVLDVRLLKQLGLALGPFVVSAVPAFLSLYYARTEWHWRG